MLCVAFAQKRHEPVQLFVMFDWETGLSASVLTETTFVSGDFVRCSGYQNVTYR